MKGSARCTPGRRFQMKPVMQKVKLPSGMTVFEPTTTKERHTVEPCHPAVRPYRKCDHLYTKAEREMRQRLKAIRYGADHKANEVDLLTKKLKVLTTPMILR